jgi:hypothetical protein
MQALFLLELLNLFGKSQQQLSVQQMLHLYRNTKEEMKQSFVHETLFDYFVAEQQKEAPNTKLMKYKDSIRLLSMTDMTYDFDFLMGVRDIVDRIIEFQKKLRNTGSYLRNHKFTEYDWRLAGAELNIKNLTNPKKLENDPKMRKRYFAYESPVPTLVQEHDLRTTCEESVLKCVEEIDRTAR